MSVPPRHQAAAPSRQGRPAVPARSASADGDDWPVDRGRPLALRVLALVGALSFLMLGLSVIAPLLQPRPQLPPPLPDGAGKTV